MFQVKLPDVYSGKSQAEQDAISRFRANLYIYGLFGPGAHRNALSFQIRKRPVSATTQPTVQCPGNSPPVAETRRE